jgi:hypothetical protein
MLTLIAGVMVYIEFRRNDSRECRVYTAMSLSGFLMLVGCVALRGKPAVAVVPVVEAPADPRGTASQQALFVVRGQEAVWIGVEAWV